MVARDCTLAHGHTDQRAARACDPFIRASDRFERLDAKYKGSPLWSNDPAFRVWMDAGRLVNSLFGIAMSDHPVMR